MQEGVICQVFLIMIIKGMGVDEVECSGDIVVILFGYYQQDFVVYVLMDQVKKGVIEIGKILFV